MSPSAGVSNSRLALTPHDLLDEPVTRVRPLTSSIQALAVAPVSSEINSTLSRPAASTSRRRGSTKTSTVADSDDESGEEVTPTSTKPAAREVQVIIPAMTLSTKKASSGATSSNSPSSTSSRAASIELDGTETPDTSLAVTPDASVDGRRAKAKGKRSRLSIESVANRDDDFDMEEADAVLARQLQEDEYAEPPRKRVKVGGHSHGVLDDADNNNNDDDDDISELSSVPSDDEVFLKPQPPSKIKIKVRARMAVPDSDDDDVMDQDVAEYEGSEVAMNYDSGLAAARAGKTTRAPLRKAGIEARRSIGQSSGLAIQDTEDDDSDFTDLESDELEDLVSAPDTAAAAGWDDDDNDDDDDDDDDDIPLALTRRANTSTTTAPATRPPARGRRRGKRSLQHNLEDTTFEDEMAGLLTNRQKRERKKLEKAHPQIKTMWKTLSEIPVIQPEQAQQPPKINRKLKSFQLEGLNWMIKMEKTHYKGGLLGDEMGMGKTIQAVSLIMSDYPQKQPTLVLVPPVALMQWASEITDYTDGTLKVLVYHGQNAKVKKMKRKELLSYDVIMISYNSLESLYRKQEKGWTRGDDIVKETSPIHDIVFHRLILDEAHSIKTRTTGVARACFALKGSYKWCLSGTPVQNRIGEFFSLLRFLEVRPFADYFCKKCPCSMLHWELNSDHRCVACNHAGMEHVSVFNQELLNPITQAEDKSVREKAMDKLHMITERIMLRRMKRDYTSSMELPPKEVIVHNEFFGEIERDFSSSIMSNTARKFDTYVAQGVMLNNYANIFGLIMQMRQVANHPDLLLKKHAAQGQNVLVCNICDEVAEDAVRSKCKHEFCRSCVKNYVSQVEAGDAEADCPRCHIALSIDFDQPEIEQDEESVKKNSIINRIKMENWTSSTKIEMLVYDLYKLRSKKQTLKSIVFSQFTSMLQLIEWRLRRAGFNTVMLDGSMTPIQRQRSIEYFMTNTDVEVFLVSLKAGGVALNLTEASRVFIVDP